MTTIVNIGRNYSPNHPTLANTPMSDNHWSYFTGAVFIALAAQGGRNIHTFRTMAEYKGVIEESASIQCFDDDDLNLYRLRAALKFLAREYGQDSIALTTAPTEFLG